MTARDIIMVGGGLNSGSLDRALESLAIRLEQNRAAPVEIVVCGGSALILSGLIARTTKDVDVLALAESGVLRSPDPLPEDLQVAAVEAAEDLGLPEEWLNNRVSRGEGGLFQMGLPAGLTERLHARRFRRHLTVHFIDRLDQIHFKLFAAFDRGGYHLTDLLALDPTPEEIEAAARWTMRLDVSEGFATVLRDLLRKIGHGETADRL